MSLRRLTVFVHPTFAGTVFAVPAERVRWCVKSEKEYQKCSRLSLMVPAIACVRKENTIDCIIAIRVRRANGARILRIKNHLSLWICRWIDQFRPELEKKKIRCSENSLH